MFLRDKQPSERSRAIGRGIQIAHLAWIVAGSAVLTLAVFVRPTTGPNASTWEWLRVLGPALVAFSIFGLVYVARKTRR
jgi:hypothetical protein